ncbi:hypothetical protein L1D14_07635 [Vibrio tubiashii]|uniref:hypothetical protein n=1 Tax=Vibrio tubiashii TaxID=29498 RepID=UPI001EFDF7D8|nr:hypothetical protein [Vibrio tubiashii]MCG9576110.1 hypothetical protein [Vibrio tubiashii]
MKLINTKLANAYEKASLEERLRFEAAFNRASKLSSSKFETKHYLILALIGCLIALICIQINDAMFIRDGVTRSWYWTFAGGAIFMVIIRMYNSMIPAMPLSGKIFSSERAKEQETIGRMWKDSKFDLQEFVRKHSY